MKRIGLPVVALVAIFLITDLDRNVWAGDGLKIVRLDPRFDRLVARDARIEKVADGFKWIEGPVWSRQENYLLFSDIPANSVFKWQEGKGVGLFLKPSGYTGSTPFAGKEPGSNGLAFDSSGELILAQHGDRRIARLEKTGSFTALAERYQGRRINSPNDLAFKSNGDIYFTDPPFGLAKAFDDPKKEIPFQGVYRLSAAGKLALLIADIKAPNGIAFSPDEKMLYLGSIEIGGPASNVAWGDDGSRLYITAGTALYRIKLTTKGVGF